MNGDGQNSLSGSQRGQKVGLHIAALANRRVAMMTMKTLMLIASLLSGASVTAEAQQTTCKNAGLDYGVGASICECPTLTSQGKTGQILSRRMVCGKNGEWSSVDKDTPCVAIDQSATSAAADFRKFQEMYCPRPATAEQTERAFETASNVQVLAALSAICRRFPAAAAQCAALIASVVAGGK